MTSRRDDHARILLAAHKGEAEGGPWSMRCIIDAMETAAMEAGAAVKKEVETEAYIKGKKQGFAEAMNEVMFYITRPMTLPTPTQIVHYIQQRIGVK